MIEETKEQFDERVQANMAALAVDTYWKRIEDGKVCKITSVGGEGWVWYQGEGWSGHSAPDYFASIHAQVKKPKRVPVVEGSVWKVRSSGIRVRVTHYYGRSGVDYCIVSGQVPGFRESYTGWVKTKTWHEEFAPV